MTALTCSMSCRPILRSCLDTDDTWFGTAGCVLRGIWSRYHRSMDMPYSRAAMKKNKGRSMKGGGRQGRAYPMFNTSPEGQHRMTQETPFANNGRKARKAMGKMRMW